MLMALERFLAKAGRIRPSRPLLTMVGAVIGFTAVLAGQLQPGDPEARLPESQRLAALVERQRNENALHKDAVEQLRQTVEAERDRRLSLQTGRTDDAVLIAEVSTSAGLSAMTGTGFTVTLNDSTLEEAPSGNVNDLVIHSYDVQAVVNAMWAAGAEAVSINDQRVVGTSAILCVGNTLLLNGTVHAPPYKVTAIGASRREYNQNPLIDELEETADRYALQYSVSAESRVQVPAYDGSVEPLYAKPVVAKG